MNVRYLYLSFNFNLAWRYSNANAASLLVARKWESAVVIDSNYKHTQITTLTSIPNIHPHTPPHTHAQIHLVFSLVFGFCSLVFVEVIVISY